MILPFILLYWKKTKEIRYKFEKGRRGYIHLCMTGGSITVNGIPLEQGDGAFLEKEEEIVIVGDNDKVAEVLLFDFICKLY